MLCCKAWVIAHVCGNNCAIPNTALSQWKIALTKQAVAEWQSARLKSLVIPLSFS